VGGGKGKLESGTTNRCPLFSAGVVWQYTRIVSGIAVKGLRVYFYGSLIGVVLECGVRRIVKGSRFSAGPMVGWSDSARLNIGKQSALPIEGTRFV
jgi:hypothetical protein